MKTLTKIFLALITIVVVIIVLAQIGVIHFGSKGIEQIDKKFGINNYSVYPTKEKASEYEKEVFSVIVFGEIEQKEKKIKISLVEFQKYFHNYLEERLKVDFEEPKCYVGSPEQKTKENFKLALEKASDLRVDLKSFEKDNIGNTSKETLQEIIENAVKTLENSKKAIEKIC